MMILKQVAKTTDKLVLNKDNCILLACKDCGHPFELYSSDTNAIECTHCKRDPIVVSGTFRLNHGVEDYGKWVPYLGQWRFKDRYDVLLKDGNVILQTYPNGGSFSPMNANRLGQAFAATRRIEDNEVLMIRLVPDDEIVEKYHFSGKERVERNQSYFGDVVPKAEHYGEYEGFKTLLR